MNIDTSVLTPNSDKASLLAAAQVSKLNGGDSGFKSQFESLSKTSGAKTESSSSDKVEKREEKVSSESKSDESSKQEEAKISSKNEEKIAESDKKQDDNASGNQKEQSGQGNFSNSGQQGQNHENQLLSDEIAEILKVNSAAKRIGSNSFQNLSFTSEISEDVYLKAPAIDYSTIAMGEDDAMFFANLVTKTDMSMQSIASEFQKSLDVVDVRQVQKTAKVSSVLMDALSESMKTNKPFRIDFDKDISVIMRVDKNGNLNANFIPGDKAVEAYLRNNISYLKQRFDEQDLPYNELTYSKHRNQERNEDKRKEEKDNE